MTRLLLVRHGETELNAEHLIQGQVDDPLSPQGREQARLLGRRLAEEPLEVVYSSDLARAAETAQIALDQRSLPMMLCPNLREMDFGQWEGRSQAEVRREFPEMAAQRRRDTMHFTPPGGEPFRDFVERVHGFLEGLLARHPEERVLIVSHGGPLSLILYYLLETAPIYPWRFRLGNASLSVAEVLKPSVDGPPARVRAVLTLLGDTCHWSRQGT